MLQIVKIINSLINYLLETKNKDRERIIIKLVELKEQLENILITQNDFQKVCGICFLDANHKVACDYKYTLKDSVIAKFNQLPKGVD